MQGKGYRTRVIMLGAVLVLMAAPAVGSAEHPASEVQVDAGYIIPGGDLADGFGDTALGFGADPGLEVGFLWRYRFDLHWSLAPAFHFVNYSNFKGTDEVAGDYTVRATSYRYGLQLRRTFGDREGWQPFVMAGVGLFRNRVEGRDKILLEPFDRSVSTLGYSFQLGVRRKQVEIGVVGQINRFSSWRFFAPDKEQDYSWDAVSLRFSWLIPGS